MGRHSTLPTEWTTLANAYGGVMQLAQAANISYSHLRRIATGETKLAHDVSEKIHTLADIAGVETPVLHVAADTPLELSAVDRNVLALLGRNLRANKTMPKSFSERYGKLLGPDLLLDVATGKDYSPDIQLAASALLGL